MDRKARLGLYLEDEEIKKRIKIASAKRGVSATAYCAETIEERLRRDGEIGDNAAIQKMVWLSRMDKLRKEIGPVGTIAADLIEAGRRR